jgi:putative hydrolase of the HAD superfamily
MNTPITHLFFDLDHTLWDTDRNAEESLNELFNELSLDQKGVPDFNSFHTAYRSHNERLWGLYAEKKVNKGDVRDKRFRDTLADFGIESPALVKSISDEFIIRTPRKTNLIEGAEPLLNSLFKRYHLAIITNGFKEAQYVKLAASGLETYFSEVYISEEVGHIKPDPLLFRHAMFHSGAEQSAHCMMIGDTYETDVYGALCAGMHAVHFYPGHGTPHPHPVITIRSLADLNQLLKTT